MKKSLLLLLVLAAPIVPTVANATPGAAVAQSAFFIPDTSSPMIVPCSSTFDKLVAELKKPGNISFVEANSTVLVGSTAFAESPGLPLGPGFNVTGGKASLKRGGISGESFVAKPGANSGKDLSFRLSKVGGIATIKWTYDGKSYTSGVDSCHSSYWTAAAVGSAIQIKLGTPASVPE